MFIAKIGKLSRRNKLKCNLKVENFETEIDVDASAVFNVAVSEWFRRGGDAAFLETHDINENSLVIDVGAYTGVWSGKINSKYRPNLMILEPVSKFRDSLSTKFHGLENVKILPYGLGAPGNYKINISNDGSSIFQGSGSGVVEEIEIISFHDFVRKNEISSIDLIQINIEGSEYDLLDQILESDVLKNIKKIQVQFHLNVPNAVHKREEIRKKLAKTHREILNFPFVWEAWVLNNASS